MSRTALRVGSALGQPGQVVRGTLPVGDAPDGPALAPVFVAMGSSEGPVLWLQGAVHGQEVGGPVSIARFLRSLDLEHLRGTVVALPVVNPLAFRAQTRNVPVDGINLNRVFPGDPSGSHTQQLAATLLEEALKVADAIVDLHSGGDRSLVPFYALYWADGSAASEQSARLAMAAGTPDLWASRDAWLEGGMFARAVERGVPTVVVECGGAASLPEPHIENFLRSLTGIAQALGLIDGLPPTQERYRLIGSSSLVHNVRGGIFVASCGPGDVLARGDQVGVVLDLAGDVIEHVTCPVDRAFIAAIRRSYHPIHSGEMICEANEVTSDG